MPIELHIPDDAWQEQRPNPGERAKLGSQLLAQVTINGISFHAEAWEIRGNANPETGLHERVEFFDDERTQHIAAIDPDGWPFEPMIIQAPNEPARYYIVVLHPHAY